MIYTKRQWGHTAFGFGPKRLSYGESLLWMYRKRQASKRGIHRGGSYGSRLLVPDYILRIL
jgi:hypothetical protein